MKGLVAKAEEAEAMAGEEVVATVGLVASVEAMVEEGGEEEEEAEELPVAAASQ